MAQFLVDVVSALDLSAIYKWYAEKDSDAVETSNDTLPADASPKETMRRRLQSEVGRAVYKMHAALFRFGISFEQ